MRAGKTSATGNRTQTIGSSGCGPTCASMVVSSIKGTITPDVMANLFVQNGYRSANNGTYWSAYRAVADEFNIGYAETSDINKTFLIEYNNKLDIMDLGGNITYNILNPKTNRLVPFVGVGLGYSIFKIADFGQVWAKDGVPVEAGTEGAVATNFESGYEETNPWYTKVMTGLNIAVSDRVNLLVSVDYKMYEDITTDNNLEFSDINSLNANLGLRLNF